MTAPLFEPPALCGPLRRPRQMLAEQRYDGHKSIHDDAMAERLGLRAGPIEGPTHFSQFDPLLHHLHGPAWFETGCLSAHYQNMVVEGEEVRAFVQPAAPGRRLARIWAEKRDGTPVLTGTASVGPRVEGEPTEPTEIEQRIAKLRPPGPLVIFRDLRVGQKAAVAERVRMVAAGLPPSSPSSRLRSPRRRGACAFSTRTVTAHRSSSATSSSASLVPARDGSKWGTASYRMRVL